MKNIISKFSALLAILYASSSFADYQILDKVVAIAEDQPILASKIRQQMLEIKKMFEQRGGNPPSDAEIYDQVLERQILDSLQLQRAIQSGMRISDQELNEAMQSIASNNGVTLSQLTKLLEQEGRSYLALREATRKSMLIQRIQQRSVMRNIIISEDEINNFLESPSGQKLLSTRYFIDHVLLPVKSNADTNDVQLAKEKTFKIKTLLKNTTDFKEAENEISRLNGKVTSLGWREANEVPDLFVSTINTLPVNQISEPLKSDSGFHLIRINKKEGIDGMVLETRAKHILLKPNTLRTLEKTETQIYKLHKELIEGANFEEMAKRYSDDTGSALSGGDLDWTTPGKMVPEFEQVMNQTEIGNISQPFQSQFGWHILTVDNRRETDKTEQIAKQKARMAIAETKYDDELNNWLQNLRNNAFVEIK